MKREREIVLDEYGRDMRCRAAVSGELRVFNLHQIAFDTCDQRAHAARFVLVYLPWKRFVRVFLIDLDYVNLSENFLQLAIIHAIFLFAKTGEDEVDPAGQRAA